MIVKKLVRRPTCDKCKQRESSFEIYGDKRGAGLAPGVRFMCGTCLAYHLMKRRGMTALNIEELEKLMEENNDQEMRAVWERDIQHLR